MNKKIVLYLFAFLVCNFLLASGLDYTSEHFLQGFQLKTLPPIMKKYLFPEDNVIPGSEKLFYKRSFNVWDQNNEKLKSFRNEKLYTNKKKLEHAKRFDRSFRLNPKRKYSDLLDIYEEIKPEVKVLMDINPGFVKVRSN